MLAKASRQCSCAELTTLMASQPAPHILSWGTCHASWGTQGLALPQQNQPTRAGRSSGAGAAVLTRRPKQEHAGAGLQAHGLKHGRVGDGLGDGKGQLLAHLHTVQARCLLVKTGTTGMATLGIC
jgi:hypothetical protein